MFFTLYAAAIAEKERGCMPRVGTSIDRRTLHYVGEVLREDTTSVLMCFICSTKHIRHSGFDAFGAPWEKGNILYYTDNSTLRYVLEGTKGGDHGDPAKVRYSTVLVYLCSGAPEPRTPEHRSTGAREHRSTGAWSTGARMDACIHACIHASMHASMHACIHACIYACMGGLVKSL